MRYRTLPLEAELNNITQTQGADAAFKVSGALLRETMATKGFQLVTGVLRNLEAAVLNQLRSVSDPSHALRLTGQLHAIEGIRRSLCALLPDAEKAQVDWFDDEDEGINVEPASQQDIG